MTGRVVVGYEGGPTGEDALAFAVRWVDACGDELHVVTVHPGAAPLSAARVDAEWVAYEREAADALLARARDLVGQRAGVTYRALDAASAAHGLHDLLETEADDVPLLVLGSRRTQGLRRTFPGRTADRLLHGAPAPVAVVPWGYADGPQQPFSRVAVAFLDTPDGYVALEHAERIAAHLSAELLAVSVVPDTRVRPSLGDVSGFAATQTEHYRAGLDAALAGLSGGGPVRREVREGPVVDALTELRPDECDLLVVGSRGYGPVRSVLLGGVSSRVVRHSRVPVVVVPRGG